MQNYVLCLVSAEKMCSLEICNQAIYINKKYVRICKPFWEQWSWNEVSNHHYLMNLLFVINKTKTETKIFLWFFCS